MVESLGCIVLYSIYIYIFSLRKGVFFVWAFASVIFLSLEVSESAKHREGETLSSLGVKCRQMGVLCIWVVVLVVLVVFGCIWLYLVV